MSNASTDGGYGLGGILLIIFVVLKLVGTINWSWVWVLSPIWITLSLAAALLLIAGILTIFDEWRAARHRGW